MSEALDSAFVELQREYLAAMPDRLEELRADITGMRQGSPEAARSLKARLHRLAGSGGSFGFLELSAIAREGESWLVSNPALEADGLWPIVDRLRDASQKAEAQLAAAASGKTPAPVPRSLLVMRPSPQRERIAQELRNAGYDVRFASRQD